MKYLNQIFCLSCFLLAGISPIARTQNLQQAQFFANPLWSNPAFAANMEFDCKDLKSNLRGSMANRRQWGSAFQSDAIGLELFHKKSRMGYALLLQNQRAGDSRLSIFSVGIALSHRISIADKWQLGLGLRADLVRRVFQFQDLRFTDQFNDQGFTGQTTADNLAGPADARLYPDFSAGLLVFNSVYWAGASVSHISRPVISELDNKSLLPMKFTLQAGMKIAFRTDPNFGLFKRDVSLHPVWQLQLQQLFSQMDAGFYYNHEPFMAGILYRGFAIIKTDADNRISQDAAVFLVGIKRDGFRLGYSVEVNLKRKTIGGFPTQELSLSYQYARKGCLRRRYGKWIPVPSI